MNVLRNWLIANNHTISDAQTVIDDLNAIVEIRRDDSHWTITGIGSLIGREGLVKLVAGLESSPITKPMVYILTSGVYLTDPDTRKTIEELQLTGLLSEEDASKLLNQGIEYGEMWKKIGLAELPSMENIEEVQASITDESPTEWIGEQILASVNISPSKAIISIRVTPIGEQRGQSITGQARTLTSTHADDDKRFDKLLSSIRELVGVGRG